MATQSDKDKIEAALAKGDDLPSGYFYDFSKNPPYWKPTPAEKAEFFAKAGIDLKAVADAEPPANG